MIFGKKTFPFKNMVSFVSVDFRVSYSSSHSAMLQCKMDIYLPDEFPTIFRGVIFSTSVIAGEVNPWGI